MSLHFKMRIWQNAKFHNFLLIRFFGDTTMFGTILLQEVLGYQHPFPAKCHKAWGGTSFGICPGYSGCTNPGTHFWCWRNRFASSEIFGSSMLGRTEPPKKNTKNDDQQWRWRLQGWTTLPNFLKEGVKPFVGTQEPKSLGLNFEGEHHRGIMEVLWTGKNKMVDPGRSWWNMITLGLASVFLEELLFETLRA